MRIHTSDHHKSVISEPPCRSGPSVTPPNVRATKAIGKGMPSDVPAAVAPAVSEAVLAQSRAVTVAPP